MKVLLIGNGAREHVIAEKLAADCELYAIMSKKNPAIAQLSKEYWICDIEDPQAIRKCIEKRDFDLGFASPDATLAAGVSDVIEECGMLSASPSKSASRIEWDKSFMRALLDKYNIKGSPRHAIVKDRASAEKIIKDFGAVAIKPLGLTGGKGVKVTGDHFTDDSEGLEYAESLLRKDGRALIEEKIVGEEFTLQAFCDGTRTSVMPPVQDHKRAHEGDKGANTGGMGSYSTGPLLPFMENSDIEEARKIISGVVHALKKEGSPFKGILYGQFMATSSGVKVVEFNARFGDPEALNVIPLMKDSLADTFLSIAEGQLNPQSYLDECTVVKYLVPDGYPENPLKDAEVKIDDFGVESSGAKVYFASVYESAGRIYTTSSRAFAVLGKGKNLDEAEGIAENGCKNISGPVWHRKDIGTKILVDGKISRMRELRRGK